MRNFGTITLRRLQETQPWTIPYKTAIDVAVEDGSIPHLLGSHVVLHIGKTLGKLASVFESLDHSRDVGTYGESMPLSYYDLGVIQDMAADLVTEAMRLANLYKFDLASRVVLRSEEKNRVVLSWPGEAEAAYQTGVDMAAAAA